MNYCSIFGCKRKIRYRTPKDLCYVHYKRWWRNKTFERINKWYQPNPSKRGYLRITVPGTHTRVFYHRFILEQFLQRKLKPEEKIHHLNGNKLDNRPKNLIIVTQSDHIHTYHPKIWKKRKIRNPGGAYAH